MQLCSVSPMESDMFSVNVSSVLEYRQACSNCKALRVCSMGMVCESKYRLLALLIQMQLVQDQLKIS